AYIADCLEALLAQEHPAVEIMVVDNGSTDGTADIVAERFPQARLIRNHRNLGFSAGNNVGLKAASGELLVLLNVDTQVHAGWLAALADAFNDPSIGIAGCKLLYPDGSIQHAGGFMYGSRGDAEHLGRFAPDDGRFDMQADVEYVTGAALAIRRSALDQIGLLDEGFSPIYYEDTDLCFRAREAGWRVVYVPQAVVTHHESTTFHTETHERKFAVHQGRLRFVFKHYSLDRLLNEFGPAERAWLRTLGRTEEVMAARHVYLATILALPGILAFRRGSTEGGSSTGDLHAQDVAPCNMADTLTGLLADLRAAAIAELTVVDVPTDHEPPPLPDLTPSPEAAGFKIGSVGGDAAALRAAVLHDLEAAQTLQEQPFVSTVPVFGKLIAAIRSLWNSVSTKWYVRPIMQQQTVFNSQVVRYLDAVSGHLERLDQAMDQIGRAIDQIGLATERHDKLTGWLSNRIHLLEVRSIRHGHLVQGQLRDTVEDVRELTDLARQVAALAPSSSSLEDRNVPASLAGIDADDRADAGTG
ncbi:MAG: glycosyltransferase family 2 protein, partial [Anaerolineae bacterium]|nr:glycosyltransferase family 2 protein [Anaerolineae bacterium]